jgi:APA family basic amino acid/polyamine antiporter
MSTTTDDAGLDRSLGLLEALTIGIGTMVGAGIFVLPGLVLERVGPAAVASFALGGTIATLCAMAAAEVATGMPRSGGGYYFVSRALGPLWGAIVGWGSWFGLIFATAFYAVGFGEYLGPVVGISPTLLALVMTVALSVLNLVSTQAAGRAQAYIVIVLLAVLAGFVGHGTLRANPSLLAGPFAPFGLGAIWAGTATLFVSYCGFGEIASMAEEIRDPGRNLPRALLGSVIGVTVLY